MIGRFFVNSERYELSVSCGKRFSDAFFKEQIVILPNFFKSEAFTLLKAEVGRMEQIRKRRDLLMRESDDSPRKMSTLSGLDIKQMSSIIPMLYLDDELRHFLSAVVGEEVCPVPDDVENYVCNFLHLEGDTHGGHIDTYPFAFNIMIEAPDEGTGGVLHLVKNSCAIEDLNDSTKVKKAYISAGDCYLLRADKAVHQVSPLLKASRRTIINFAYANKVSLNLRSYSSSVLYGE